ncbi:MAG: VCBS repeat-containing protein, partial [Bacteroidota bacterium]
MTIDQLLLSIALVLYLTVNGTAQFTAERLISEDDKQEIYDLDFVDIDGDGDVDVFAAFTNTNVLAWLENRGGIFTDPIIISDTEDNVSVVSHFDIDGDGDLDILVGYLADLPLSWFEYDSSSKTFTKRSLATAAEQLLQLEVADLDADNLMDIVVYNFIDNEIAWYEQETEGRFTRKVIFENATSNFILIDIENDGDIDIVRVQDHELWWHENTGDSRFAEGRVLLTESSEQLNIEDVKAIDYDGDGDTDLVYAVSDYSFDPNRVAWIENTGVVPNSSQVLVTVESVIGGLLVADHDNDGDFDLAVLPRNSGDVFWYENVGTTYRSRRVLRPSESTVRDIFSADLNQDGYADIISISWADERIAAMMGSATNDFEMDILFLPIRAVSISSTRSADLDADGDVDLLFSSAEDGRVSWLENDGDGNFLQQHNLTFGLPQARSVNYADFDNDGDLDIIASRGRGGRILRFINDGEGSFSTATSIYKGERVANELFCIDVDEDGFVDILAGGEGYLYWFKNNNG